MSADRRGRGGDPPGFDPRALRGDPLAITVRRDDLAQAFSAGRNKTVRYGIIAGAIAGLIAAAIVGALSAGWITRTVRHDVDRAAVFNCQRTNSIRPAVSGLKTFLTSDAGYAQALARLDIRQRQLYRTSSTITNEIGRTLTSLGPLVPKQLGEEYARWASIDRRQAAVFARLEQLRASSAQLWAGAPHRTATKKVSSLADQITLIGQAPCAKILLP